MNRLFKYIDNNNPKFMKVFKCAPQGNIRHQMFIHWSGIKNSLFLQMTYDYRPNKNLY